MRSSRYLSTSTSEKSMGNRAPYTILISERAKKEIIASFDWYEERQEGLGTRFQDEVVLKLNQIRETPELYGVKEKGFREVLLPVFPLLIIYKIDKRKRLIRVVSVFHTSRNISRKY